MADKDRALICAKLIKKRQPVSGARFHVVGKRPVDDLEAKMRQFPIEPWQPDVAGGAATVAMDQNDFELCVHSQAGEAGAASNSRFFGVMPAGIVCVQTR